MRRTVARPHCSALLVRALLDWFARAARDLPWRHTLDPYAVWVSEIMLQQTQVKTVIPYWERWMRELPDLRSLAAAPPEKVLKLWEGLGYYTRARNLQKAAQQLARDNGGNFPATFDAALALPGIGRYTAGAVTSIAFNQPSPILDGNVIRVLARLFGIAENPKAKTANASLWKLAAELVRAAHTSPLTAQAPFPLSGSCSALNQSLMELGALVCTPRQPRCEACPVRRHCAALATHQVDSLPNLGKRAPATAHRFAAFLVQRDGCWLVRQRPTGVVNARLWEFPNVELPAQNSDILSVAAQLLGCKSSKLTPFCRIQHSITRYRISLEAWTVMTSRKPRAVEGEKWLKLEELDALPFTSAHRQILRKLRDV